MGRIGLFGSVVVLSALNFAWSNTIQYMVTDLGSFGGNLGSYATGINNLGQICGYSYAAGGGYFPFVYSGGTLHQIPSPPGYNWGIADGINNSGQVVGGFESQSNSGGSPFLYSGGSAAIYSLPYGGGGQAVNDSGQIVGIAPTDNYSSSYFAFLYSGHSMTNLGNVSGGTASNATGINNLGQIVGDDYMSGGSTHAFLDSGGSMHDLGTLSGGTSSWAAAINDGGQIVGTALNSQGLGQAFLYNSGSMQDLGTLGGEYSDAYGINAAGLIVGDAYTGGGADHAFLFSNGSMQDLNHMLVSAGSGWTLYEANGINASGQIVGRGMNPRGQYDAFLLTPTPEPSSLALLGVGAISFAVYAWRRRSFARRKPKRAESAQLQDGTPLILAFPAHSSDSACMLRRAA